MKYRSVFDIIGPVMIGPSSSHTAGAVRIGQLARKIYGREPQQILVQFYGSFAETYKGHATDVAVIGGILAFETDDARIPDSLAIAAERGITVTFSREEAVPNHPNTMKITLQSDGDPLEVTGISIGGGTVQITELNGFPLRLSGDNPALLILHKDAYGTIASVTDILAIYRINVSNMEVSRIEKGKDALMVIETDQSVPPEAIQIIANRDNILKVIVLEK